MKSDIVERAFEKYSNRQLEYVGDICNGKDFDAIDSLNYEMKCLDGLIQKTTYNTKKYNYTEKVNSSEPRENFNEELFEQFKQFIVFQKMMQDK